MSSQLYTNSNWRLAVVMVGLPATGKTFTARNLSRYLRWLGVRTRTFSVAAYRRAAIMSSACTDGFDISGTADFFDPERKECLNIRTEIAERALHDLLAWLDFCGGQVGILDGSNTIKARRDRIESCLEAHKVQCVFLECSNSNSENISLHMEELLLTCPEYAGWKPNDALADYLKRISHYRVNYQPIDNFPPQRAGFLQSINGGEQLIVERVNGFLCSRITYYLMNLRHSLVKRSIFIMPIQEGITTSEEINNVGKSIMRMMPANENIQIWTTTAPSLSCFRMMPRLRALELGLPPTPDLTPTPPPNTDPYFARNPQGESYHDLAIRLEPLIMELEGGTGITLICADSSVCKCIYGYFCEKTKREIVEMEVEEGVVVGLRPRAYGCYEQRFGAADMKPIGEETLRLYNDNLMSPK